jgi:hypothetical protein
MINLPWEISQDEKNTQSMYYVILSSSLRGQHAYVLANLCCSSQAARRDQNRIAQREFRLRKQQKVPSLVFFACPQLTLPDS